jgi:hypothetical protein
VRPRAGRAHARGGGGGASQPAARVPAARAGPPRPARQRRALPVSYLGTSGPGQHRHLRGGGRSTVSYRHTGRGAVPSGAASAHLRLRGGGRGTVAVRPQTKRAALADARGVRGLRRRPHPGRVPRPGCAGHGCGAIIVAGCRPLAAVRCAQQTTEFLSADLGSRSFVHTLKAPGPP